MARRIRGDLRWNLKNIRMNTRLIHLPSTLLAAAVAALITTAAAPDAAADHRSSTPVTGTVDIKTGITSVTLADSFKTALTTAGIETRKMIPGQFVKGKQTFRFPIRGGAFDLATLQAECIHAGGITLKSSTVTVRLSDFVVTLPGPPPASDPGSGVSATSSEVPPVAAGPQADLTALVVVNGALVGRVSLFAVDATATGLTAPLTLGKHKKLSVPNLGLFLTAEGAGALNAAFGVTSFIAGDAAGTASILSLSARSDK